MEECDGRKGGEAMEQGMTRYPCHRGFMLVTVLVITAIGLLFGAGALLLFRYQCQLRIDRQHELEKVYAVRSALNYIKGNSTAIDEDGTMFSYHTVSGRDLGLLVKPVAEIFPVVTNIRHFVMERGDINGKIDPENGSASKGWHCSSPDYECGWDSKTNLIMDVTYYGLAFADKVSPKGARWWVNIGMADTGGWLQEDYGRRYYFLPSNYAGTDSSRAGDIIRLCIIRSVTNAENQVGRQYGWPLSKEGERAIVFQVRELTKSNEQNNGVVENNAVMSISEYEYTQGAVKESIVCGPHKCPSSYRMGLQLSEDKVSAFYIENAAGEDINKQKPRGGYTFYDVGQLTSETYNYFAEGSEVIDGKIHAPDLRAVFEVEAASEKRADGLELSELGTSDITKLTRFRVTPAYQFDVFIEHPTGVTNRATVAQKTGYSRRVGRKIESNYTVLTYDTHGTDNKGFRKDEKDWAAKRGGGE